MKKILLILMVLFLIGCAKKDVDPYLAYRSKTSTQLFNDGEKALFKKDYSLAVRNFEALDVIYPFGPYTEQSLLDMIYAYYKNNDEASAVATAERYLHLYPRGPHADYVYYMRGIVGFNQGLSWFQKTAGVDPAPRDIDTLQDSYKAFSTLAHRYPQSPYAQDALVRMKYIRNLIARRELMIADFYFRRGAYVAAANRANSVFQHFEGSPEVAKALALMVRSYRALNLQKLANDSYQILATNYPNDPNLIKLKQ